MKVYVSMDAEGISGIFNIGQVMQNNREFAYARRMMANDINAAAAGAFNAGATEFVVNDAHNHGNNLIIDQLDERIDLIQGSFRPMSMAEGVDEGYDAALLIGYHRRKGGKGVASHSYSYTSMVELKINGKISSEHDLVGYAIGYYGTPVVFLSGDNLVIEDAKESIPSLYTVETKVAISNSAAKLHHPARNAKNITETVEKALRNFKADGIKPMTIEGPVDIDVRYTAEVQGTLAARAPGAERINETTVRYHGEDYMEAYKTFLIGSSLAGSFRDDAELYK